MAPVDQTSRFTGAVIEYIAGENSETFTVATTAVVGGRLVKLNGDRTVAPAGATDSAIGMAAHDAAVGKTVTVWFDGVWPITASGAIAAGDILGAGANGTVATIAAAGATYAQAEANSGRRAVSVAEAAAADTATCRVRLRLT